MSVRALIVLSLGLMVAACAAVPINTLTQDKRDSLRIASVDVGFAEDATIEWYDAQAGAPEEPAARLAFLKQKAIGPIKAALNAEILPAFRGTDPATLRVRIRTVRIPAAAMTIIVANIPYAIRADMELIDTRTGTTLLAASDFDGLSHTFGGVLGIVQAAVAEDPIIRVSKAFAHVLTVWLKTGVKQAMG
jgi:hypothetical protein